MRRFGAFRNICLGVAPLVLASACVGGIHYGFAGGGLPDNIRTIAVQPFDNQTQSPDLPKELYDQMRHDILRRLGLRDAPQERADAVVRGVIQTYDADVPVSYSSDPNQSVSSRRRLQIVVDVEIVEQATGKVLFQRKGLRAENDYAERAESEGRKGAIQKLVSDMIEGAQSQW